MLMRFLHSTYDWGWPSNWGMKLSLKLFVSRLVEAWAVDTLSWVPGSIDPMELFVVACGVM